MRIVAASIVAQTSQTIQVDAQVSKYAQSTWEWTLGQGGIAFEKLK